MQEKATMAENASFEAANLSKDVIALRRILQSCTFSYRSSEEPIMTMLNAKLDLANIRQQPRQSVQDYFKNPRDFKTDYEQM